MDTRRVAQRWNLYAALAFLGGLIVTISGAMLVMIFFPQPRWTDLSAFRSAYHPVQSLIFVPSLALPLSITALLTTFHAFASPEERPWSLLALGIGIVGTTVLCINYVIQGVVVPSLVRQASDMVGILVSANPGSLFWALEMFGYSLTGLGMWAAAPLFRVSRIDAIIRPLLAINGVGSLLAALGTAIDSTWVLGPLGLTVVLAWNVLMVVLAILLVRRSCSTSKPASTSASPGSSEIPRGTP